MNSIKVELQEYMGSDISIANAAWTSSYNLETKLIKTEEDVKRVVTMLANEKHSVPFESVVFRFWIKLPIAIDRQHMTHRIASHSGMSGRYRTMPDEFYDIPEDINQILAKTDSLIYAEAYSSLCEETNKFYQNTIQEFKKDKEEKLITPEEYKRLREFFRGVLPQHNMTERVTVINLRSFANYYKLRAKNNAQPEIQYIANSMLALIKEKNICPIAIESLEKNNWII